MAWSCILFIHLEQRTHSPSESDLIHLTFFFLLDSRLGEEAEADCWDAWKLLPVWLTYYHVDWTTQTLHLLYVEIKKEDCCQNYLFKKCITFRHRCDMTGAWATWTRGLPSLAGFVAISVLPVVVVHEWYLQALIYIPTSTNDLSVWYSTAEVPWGS